MYEIIRLSEFEPEEERFETEEEAITWGLEVLPSDDFAYVVADAETNDYLVIVYQGLEWRPS